MRVFSTLAIFLTLSLAHAAHAEMGESVCYYQVITGGRLLTKLELESLKFENYLPVVGWGATGKKTPTMFGFGKPQSSEFFYTIQTTWVGDIGNPSIDKRELQKELASIKVSFERFLSADIKVSFNGCKTTPLHGSP